MNLFETVKAAVTPRMAAERYGLPIQQGGMVCCPFHADRTPSMKLNEDYFYCFGCGATGDVIDLAARLFDLSKYEAVQKLAAVQETVAESGCSLLIWDAFRPVSAQFRLWEICPDPAYVANPEKGFSSHSRGNTVDVTLVTIDGQPVDMPTDFDDFTALADRDYSDVEAAAAANARLLESAMTAAGFRPYSAEWWHYSDTQSYPVDEQFIPLS